MFYFYFVCCFCVGYGVFGCAYWFFGVYFTVSDFNLFLIHLMNRGAGVTKYDSTLSPG